MHSMKLYSYTSNPTESVAFPCIEYYPMVALAEHALASASFVLSVRLVVLRISVAIVQPDHEYTNVLLRSVYIQNTN